VNPNVSAALDCLARRLPEQAWRARGLALRDQGFRAICEDYAEALQALELWRRQDGAGADRAREFHQMVMELQQELLEYLSLGNQSAGGPACTPGDPDRRK